MLTRQPPPPDFEWKAESIHALRSHLGQSQAALARELGIRQQTVSEWETGMYKPRGASVTILTLLAVSSGFQFDMVASKDKPRQSYQTPDVRPAGNGAGVNGQPQSSPARPVTHPDWVSRPSQPGGLARASNNYITRTGSGFHRDGPEIPI